MKLQGCKTKARLRRQLFKAVLAASASVAVTSHATAQSPVISSPGISSPAMSQSERTFGELLASFDQTVESDEGTGVDSVDDAPLKRDVAGPTDESTNDEALRSRSAEVEKALKKARETVESSKDAAESSDLQSESEIKIGAAAEFNPDQLVLADVIASLYRSYPDIQAARRQTQVASGELLSAYGSYDTKFQAHSLAEPTGFYRSYRNGLGVARQTWWGGYVSAGYRIGRGLIQPWYQERQTNDAGEFKVSLGQALLQGRAIDPQRVAVFQASLEQQAVGPIIQKSILDVSRDAVAQYWKWVAAGAILDAQRELLRIAEYRAGKFRDGVEADFLPEVDLIFNDQLVAERQSSVLKAEQKYRAASFKLSVFLRDESGQPMLPEDAWLPSGFPGIAEPESLDFAMDLGAAIGRRPELEILQIQQRQVSLDRRLARNDMLPRFDFIAEASQDMGEMSSKSDDKGDFELVIGFTSEVPIQRRKARGKIQSTSGKIEQINEKLRITRDKIAADLQTSQNALQLTSQVVRQNEAALKASLDVLERYRFAFDKGKIDLIYLNLLETKANETAIKLLEAKQAWFMELGMLQYVLGLDPLDQAMTLSAEQAAQPEAAQPEAAQPEPAQ